MGFSAQRLVYVASGVAALYGGSVLLKDYITGGAIRLDDDIQAKDKVVIVTGSNTGIGKETVHGLAQRRARVYMACRDLDACEESRKELIFDTRNRHIYCKKCDLSDFNSIRDFVKEFKQDEQKLDILINNAGVMRCPKMLTQQGIEMQLGVNHMGHFLLTNLLLDSLKASAPSRIVNLSSVAHVRGKIKFEDLNSDKSYDPGEAYNQSKLANILFTQELAKRLEGTGVTVNAVHPGLVFTEIGRHMSFAKSTFSKYLAIPIFRFLLKTPIQGSYTTLYVALDPGLEKVTGKYFSDQDEKEPAEAANDLDAASRLWLTSEKWTRLAT